MKFRFCCNETVVLEGPVFVSLEVLHLLQNLVENLLAPLGWITSLVDCLQQVAGSSNLLKTIYKAGYPPEWSEEIFHKVLEQVENFKRYEYRALEDNGLIAAEPEFH